MRYSELSRLISSRGTLSMSLKELEEEELLVRRIVSSRPVQSYYSLSKKGRVITSEFKKASETLSKDT